jgi:hypothetical protein
MTTKQDHDQVVQDEADAESRHTHPTRAPAPRDAFELEIDAKLRAQIKALPPGQSFPVFVRDEVVAAHYGVPVNTFVLLPPDEALYMLEGRWAYSVHGPNIAAGNYLEHPIAGAFVPFEVATAPAPEPPAPEPPPPEPAPSPPATRSTPRGQ